MSDALKEALIISAFLLLVIDRGLVLCAICTKARKILVRPSNSAELEVRMLNFFVDRFHLLLMGLPLAVFTALSLMQVIQRASLSNDTGRAIFALLAFMLSVYGTLLSICIERIDLRRARLEAG